MSAAWSGCIVIFSLFTFPGFWAQEYPIPDVTIQALYPRGLRASIPDHPRLRSFSFYGIITRSDEIFYLRMIKGNIVQPQNGLRTVYKDTQMKVGDVVTFSYVLTIKENDVFNTIRTVGKSLKTNITELVDPDTPLCQMSVSEIRTGKVCVGQTIFEDRFDTLNEDLWSIEHYLPKGPEHPFVSYQRPPNTQTVVVEDGILRILPKLQRTLPGFNNSIVTGNDNKFDLTKRCTKSDSCFFINAGSQIMPPVASGRITSKAFVFKYGFIEIRAKLPQGDWLYPDISLEPFICRFGVDDYASGIMRIASALGNLELTKNSVDYGNKVLYGGPIMDFRCRSYLLSRKMSATAWGDRYHIYALRWAPDGITLFVDGEEWGRITPAANGLQERLPQDTCDLPRDFLSTPMAPFDDFFYISLGVSVGGISEFPDESISQNGVRKPWRNNAMKARLTFLDDLMSWWPTWTQPGLLVDYVTVRAL